MEKPNLKNLIDDIKTNLKQCSASSRDETRVMKEMLNDRDFVVTDYSSGEQHCPANDFRNMITGIVSATTKISKAEADALVSDYDVRKSDAETMVQLSKDFINSSLKTGRKINLGADEKSNISIQLKHIPEAQKKFPRKTGYNSDGSPRYEKAETIIPEHYGLKVSSPCPSWIDSNKNK